MEREEIIDLVSKGKFRSINFRGADLTGLSLKNANLRDMDLSEANLEGVNLYCARLNNSILIKTNLKRAYLSCAVLNNSIIYKSDLTNATLYGAEATSCNFIENNLNNTNLSKSNLYRSVFINNNLTNTNFTNSELQYTTLPPEAIANETLANRSIVGEDDLIGYKKLHNSEICKLLIPKEAKRFGGYLSRKCRAEYAVVIEGSGESGYWEKGLNYKKGEIVKPHFFDPNPFKECSGGIHFFLTREEAENYC